MTRVRIPKVASFLVCIVASGCSQDSTPQPPTIYYGQTECDHCKMIISDERFAAGLAIEAESGDCRSVAFDDFGCLVQFQLPDRTDRIAARFVRDYQTGQWLDAATAMFVFSPELQTPMASHVAALATRSAAEELNQTLRGRILEFSAVASRIEEGNRP